MVEGTNKASAREKAISVHDEGIDWFLEQYHPAGDNSYLASAFLYGRHQIEICWNRHVANLHRGAKVLDVGCGTGEQIAHLLDAGLQVYGVEPSEKMRAFAQSRLPAGTVRDGSVLNLPFENSTLDFVYAIEVFRYLMHDDNLEGLREVHRVLKPGGMFFGTFVNLYALNGFSLLVGARRLISRCFQRPLRCHTEFETPASLERNLQAVGFSKVHTHGAMLASLLIAYKLAPRIGTMVGGIVEPIDARVSDFPPLRRFAGHLIGVAWK
jgi:ubiquinone/menaquinone biosynthesis C-methylase UbiE